MVEIRVLGPVELGSATDALPLTAEKQRRLLAALVARAGETCSTDRLIDAVWGAAPPASAEKLLQVYVSQLRKLVRPASIRRRGASYALELNGGSVDAVRFERLFREARAALTAGNAALAVSLLQRGLALWRGPAYGEFGYEQFARGEASARVIAAPGRSPCESLTERPLRVRAGRDAGRSPMSLRRPSRLYP